jgi:hypothetical protein
MNNSRFSEFFDTYQAPAGVAAEQPFSLIDEVPFPIDAFPYTYSEIIRQATTTLKSEACHIGTAMLGAVSLAIGNTTRVQVSSHYSSIPATTWMVLIEPSGGGKGVAQKFGYGPLEKIKRQKMIEVSNARTQLAKDILDLRRDIYQCESADIKKELSKSLAFKEKQEIEDHYITIDDITMEAVRKANLKNRRGIGIVRDEISGWWNSFGKYSKGGAASSEESFYIETYDGADLIPFRSGSNSVICPMPFTTVFGGTQPDTLTDFGRNNRLVSGFVFRILFSFPEEKPMRHKQPDDFIAGKSKAFEKQSDMYNTCILRIMEGLTMRFADEGGFVPEPKIILFSEDAITAYTEWFNGKADFVNNINGDKRLKRTIRSIVSRIDMNFYRLCLLIETMKWTVGESALETISRDTVQRVDKLMEYYRYTIVKVYTEVEKINMDSGSPRPRRTQISYKKVFGKREELTKPELLKRITEHYNITELTAEKYVLEDEKQLIPGIITRKDGRSKVYKLNEVK